MDPFEPIRATAARMHDDFVKGGVDGSTPSELVQAAVLDLGLELFWLSPNDPALKGARGLFDEQSGAICCIDAGTEADRAALVAHEIGHARLHSSSAECSADDVDPSRSTEQVPVGLQRVEDYGVRERRELQANVFAREFLLPRALARQLYLEKSLSASAIIRQNNLPQNLVRQQLLDALLLPRVPAVSEVASEEPAHPDQSQDDAVTHRGSPFQLQAGPGTGKTRTLIRRVLSLVDEGIDPNSILVLTFSNRAAGELSERIAEASPDAAQRVWVGTFHAFGLDLLRRYHDRLGLSPNPILFDRSDAITVLQEILPTQPLVHYLNLWDPSMILRDIVLAISRAKDELIDPERYRELAEKMREGAIEERALRSAEKCLEIAHIYDLYEEALREHSAVDFGDLIMRPTVLLESDAALRTEVQIRHRHVLVDEYQDVNRATVRLLRAVAGDGYRLWVVGDSRQAIYRFRGASSANMAAFQADYPDAVARMLSTNYRSTEEIVDAFVGFAPRMGASSGMLHLALDSHRGPSGIQPEIRKFETLAEEAEGVAASIREIHAAGTQFKDQAVLCRSNRRVNEMASELEARGIPVLHLGSLFERNEIRDLLALMSLVAEPLGDGLVRVGSMPRYDLTLQDVLLATRTLREGKGQISRRLAKASRTPGISAAGVSGLTLLSADISDVATSSSPWEFLAVYLLDRTDIIAKLANSDSIADRMRAVAIWQFLNFVRHRSPAGAGLPIRRTLDTVRQLVLLSEERDLRQLPANALHINAVRLMTVHGSKGLEFEAVHVPDLTQSSFPASYRGNRCAPPDGMIAGAEGITSSEEGKLSHSLEEECLFFVAIARARTYLRLYYAARLPSGRKRKPSQFIEDFRARILQISPAMSILPEEPGSEAVRVAWPEEWNLTDRRLRLFEKCPRRFFYTHVLGLTSASKRTAFSRTHDCIYEFIAWFSEVRLDKEPDAAAVEDKLESIWRQRGPTKHPYSAEYRRLAQRLVSTLVRASAGRHIRPVQPLPLDFPLSKVVVEPDELARLPDGRMLVRRIRTGRRRVNEYDRLEYTLYLLAAQQHFGNATVEALHLTDEALDIVNVTPRKMKTRKAKSEEMFDDIVAGRFPPQVDAVSCPRCPHFFICAAAPSGDLDLR